MLLGILLVAVLISAVPWAYRILFIHSEDFIVEELDFQGGDFFNFLNNAELGKDISLDIGFLGDGYVFSRWTIKDVKLRNRIISADIVMKGRFVKDERDAATVFSGKIFSDNLRLKADRDSAMSLRASFSIDRDKLKIESFRLARSYDLKGTVGLVEPFEIDLVFDVKRADIKDVALFTKLKIKNPELLFGVMSGVVYIKGPLSNLFSNGIIQSRNGKVGPIAYEVATIRIEGFGPVINIADSSIRQHNGRLAIEGYIDLRDIGKGILFDGLKVKSNIGTIAWDGWDIAKKGRDELTMSREISDTMRVGFKTAVDEPFTNYYERENTGEMSLEYKMGMENLKMKLRDNEEFLIIEHSISF